MKLSKKELDTIVCMLDDIDSLCGLKPEEQELKERIEKERPELTDFVKIKNLLDVNNISYRETALYSSEDNSWCGWAVWLDTGHFEFSTKYELTNIVDF